MKKIVFATHNSHKLDELRQIVGTRFEILGLDDIGCTADIPEDADTLEENARAKARWVVERFGYRCFADDTGLEVDALGGEPGVFSARYAARYGDGAGHDSQANMRVLLDRMHDVPADKRTARFRTVIAVAGPDGEDAVMDGVVEGYILDSPRGTNGFGYDPVFRPEGCEGTFAEIPAEQKNAISHRGRATRSLMRYLDETK